MVQRVHFVFVTMPSDSERTKLDIQPLGSKQRVLPSSRFVRANPAGPVPGLPAQVAAPRRMPAATPNVATRSIAAPIATPVGRVARPVASAIAPVARPVARVARSVAPAPRPIPAARATPTPSHAAPNEHLPQLTSAYDAPRKGASTPNAVRPSARAIDSALPSGVLRAPATPGRAIEIDTAPSMPGLMPGLEAPVMMDAFGSPFSIRISTPVVESTKALRVISLVPPAVMAAIAAPPVAPMAQSRGLIGVVPPAVMAALASPRSAAAPVAFAVPYLPPVAEVLRDDVRTDRSFRALTKRSLLAANIGALCAVVAILAGYLAT